MGIYEQVVTEETDGKTLPERILALPREALYFERDTLFDYCEALQKTVLKEILDGAQGSAYAKDHDFDGITEMAQWRTTCPISTYEDYLAYIDSEIHGSPHQLYNTDTKMVVATTGSTGRAKLYLESEAGNAAKLLVMVVRGMIMGDLLPVTRDYSAKNLTISNYSKLGTTPSGHTVVRASGQTARNLRRKAGPMNILTVPFWEVEGLSAQEREYVMAVFALSDDRLSKIFCNNLIAFGRILDLIDRYAAHMIEDVRRGTFSLALSDAVKARLGTLFTKNEARADVLAHILADHGTLVGVPEALLEVWPNLQMASCWMSGSVGRDACDVIGRLPKKVRYFDMGYGSSEGKFNIPVKLANPSGAAALFSAFFEFIPLNGDRSPLCLWELQDGAHYELLVTTYSGLYRYQMLDIVCVDGFTGNTPNIVFCGKSTETLTCDGNTLYGYQLTDAVRVVEKKQKVLMDLVQVYVEGEDLYYILASRQSVDYHLFYRELKQLLREEWDVSLRGLYVVRASYKERLFDQRILPDRGACGIKLPIIVDAPPRADEQIDKIV